MQPLDFVDRGGLCDVFVVSPDSIMHMVYVGQKVVASSVFPLFRGAHFAKKLCYFFASLERARTGSDKTRRWTK